MNDEPKASEETIAVPLRLLQLIDRVFLPRNPNKMRGAHPDVPSAVKELRAILGGRR